MDIFKLINCKGCPSYRIIPGRYWGDPDSCYPDEAVCGQGAPEKPCEQALDAVHDMVLSGEAGTKKGYFVSREDALQMQKEGEGELPEDYDFSSAPYHLIPFEGDGVISYESTEEVYRELM